MINYNGTIQASAKFQEVLNNRAFKYGDGLFETIRVSQGKIEFSEDHYFRLMASMRMLGMDISMEFTLEYFDNEILKLVRKLGLSDARVRFSVFRDGGGRYLPQENNCAFFIEASELSVDQADNYEVDLYKDYYVYSGILSTLKTNNRILNVLASNFAADQGLDNCLLLNETKHLTEAINGNIFLIKGKHVATPALSQGCIKGIARKKIIEILKAHSDYQIEETTVSPFELLKADEVFISNSIIGIQPITKYRKKVYQSTETMIIARALRELASVV